MGQRSRTSTLAQIQLARERQMWQQQRQAEQVARAQAQAGRARARADAANQRERERLQAEERKAYAEDLTREVDQRLADVGGVLRATLHVHDWLNLDELKEQIVIPAFNPGGLDVPVPMPDPERYRLPVKSGLRSLSSRAKAEQEAAQTAAWQRYHRDRAAAQASETQRQEQLAAYWQRFQAWVAAEQARVAAQHGEIDALKSRLAAGDGSFLVEYLSDVLGASRWPEGFPQHYQVAWDASSATVVVDYHLPTIDAIPKMKRYRYVLSSDTISPIPLPENERRRLYRDMIAQVVLRVVHEIFEGDRHEHVHRVICNGIVVDDDPRTGQRTGRYVATLSAGRTDFLARDLSRIDPLACLKDLRGQLSSRPDDLEGIQPPLTVGQVAGDQRLETDLAVRAEHPNLLEMDPTAFEALVAELLGRMGLRVQHTGQAGDGGVDVVAQDTTPLVGGDVIVQVKRYRSPVGPEVVRDLFGTLHHRGASRGLLVTTSRFGPDAHEFAAGKPLRLVSGAELLDLLGRYGIDARIAYT